MKLKLFFSVFFLSMLNFCIAQDSAVVLATSMFDENYQQIYLASHDGWIYKEGNDTTWARNDIDLTDWKKFRPDELTVKNADKGGRVEGWFRIKIKLDNSFKNILIGITAFRFMASDVFIDGKYLTSFGATGLFQTAYKENVPAIIRPVQLNFQPGEEHLICLRIVEYVSSFNPYYLQSEEPIYGGLNRMLIITGPDSFKSLININMDIHKYIGIWLSMCIVLTLLFWFLYFLNRTEKNLLLIALKTSFLAVNIFLVGISATAQEITSFQFVACACFGGLFSNLSDIMTVLIVVNIFNRKLTTLLKMFVSFSFFFSALDSFFPHVPILGLTGNFIILVIIIYYLFSSWKTLRGAQWIIVAGLFLTSLSLALYLTGAAAYNSFPFPYAYTIVTSVYFSFPLALLAYVSLRFKEIISEVRLNAQKVLIISKEKEEILSNQNLTLEKQVAERTKELNRSLHELKSTQSQLIQSEKMASLGELTAGIAHEIQNPLNFVNNFSEVNTELIEELKGERRKAEGERNTAIEDEIIDDIEQNLEKINHHGKRADSIVKGMLQHSQKSTGQKEPTDINKLTDEYLRLSYHGMRAKDKDFNADIKTEFDESIGKINVIPQDIGRVLLNLYNNAFYAVNEKKKQAAKDLSGFQNLTGLNNYQPTVIVTTKKTNDKVLISVKDNGNGIPQKIVDKIFQPFFTTKPTGQGTGLGLSLAYDIIRAHGGEINVVSKEGEGTEFIIVLPA